ncbi:MAG: alpha-amylase family glycosyl hydrolase [Planctomycetota bacterium]|nr:alpha-amylase family glycosyl hydrolase [Planctomycetota bacterium]
MALDFDETTGALLSIRYKGDALATCETARSPLSFGVGPQDQIKWLENFAARGTGTVVKREQPAADTLEFTIRAGDFELVERYKLHAAPARLDRSLTLTNRGPEAVKLRNVNFKTFGVAATKDGFYRFPHQWPPQSHTFAEMKKGQKHGGGGSIAPLVAQLSPTRSLLWLSYATDPSWLRVEEGDGRFDVVQDVQAAGFLKPNEPQEIGFVSMQVVEAGYWEALPAMWRWMDSVGLKVPADRPAWVEEAILYCFHPGGTIGSNFKDLGGFKNATEYLLPTIPKLGATAIWIMPIEQKSPYWPFDYYKFMDGLGTAEDYKALVKRAHELGLRVWQDMVPHGGSPQAVHNKAHPEFMLRREDGSNLNYWLNDFALPEWQKFMAGVATHYCREYGVDGYRVDACGGSKEPNWNPDIPYARASHALLWGGLGMLGGIRKAVRDVNPKDGAILAEAEGARLLAVADAQYDFGFCYNVCHQWRREPAADFVAHLQEYLEEQKYVEPRGAVRLRHVESHDSLRAELWYGVDGMHAMYALSAWIDGIPLIYHGMENGHSFALRAINEIRKSRPELSRGEAFYRAVKCDAPDVFTCLRKLGDKQSVVVINFGRDRVKATLTWPGGQAQMLLEPLAFNLWPEPPPSNTAGPVGGNAGNAPDGGELKFTGATEWWVESLCGRLHGDYTPPPVVSKTGWYSGIYWRPQGTGILWQHDVLPLQPFPVLPQIGARTAKGFFAVGTPESAPAGLRLMADPDGLRLTGLGTAKVCYERVGPFSEGTRAGAVLSFGSVTFCCVGPDLIVSNDHYTVALRRQGGVVRELFVDGKVVAKDHDLYGDQEYMKASESDRIAAGDDVECSLRIEKVEGGLKLSFEGQLRGFWRFALKKPPIWFRNEYVFTDAPRFHQKYAFRTEKTFKDKNAFLAAIVQLPSAERFRFARGNESIVEDVVGQGTERRGQTKGKPAPERVEFLAGGARQWGLSGLRVPEGSDCNLFIHGRQFFITFLDGKGAAMEQGKWYEFEADWEAEPNAK